MCCQANLNTDEKDITQKQGRQTPLNHNKNHRGYTNNTLHLHLAAIDIKLTKTTFFYFNETHRCAGVVTVEPCCGMGARRAIPTGCLLW